MSVVPPVLGLAEAMVHNLQLAVLVRRRNYTITEKVILMLQLCKLMRDGIVVLIICVHTQALLDDGHG
jgi:hypothetical protein